MPQQVFNFFDKLSQVDLSTNQVNQLKHQLDEVLSDEGLHVECPTVGVSNLNTKNLFTLLKNRSCDSFKRPYASAFTSFPDRLDQLCTNILDDQGSILNDGIIKVEIEKVEGHYLVKILPPCDLSPFNLNDQELMVRLLVEQALQQQNLHINFDDLYISVNFSVKGQIQHIKDKLGQFDYTQEQARHQNGFIKTPGEQQLTRIEPRDGPQATFDDGICAMVTTLCLAQFEDGVRRKLDWTKQSKNVLGCTLKHPDMTKLFHDIQVTSASRKSQALGVIVSLMLTFAEFWNRLKYCVHKSFDYKIPPDIQNKFVNGLPHIFTHINEIAAQQQQAPDCTFSQTTFN